MTPKNPVPASGSIKGTFTTGTPLTSEWTLLHDALAYAFVLGWYAGCAGEKTDEGKIEAAKTLIAGRPDLQKILADLKRYP